MARLIHTSALCVVLLASLPTQARAGMVTIDFASGVIPLDGSRIDTVGPLTFSRNITPDHPDGWTNFYGEFARTWYGENGEYFDFDAPVHFHSLKMRLESWPVVSVTSISMSLYDYDLNLLGTGSVASPVPDDWYLMDFTSANLVNVSRVKFEFEGGSLIPDYNDPRYHAWIGIDDVTFETEATAVPEPTSLALLGFVTLGIGINTVRRRNRGTIESGVE